MFGFIKKYFFTAMAVSGSSVLSVNTLKCVSMNNQECKIRTKIIDVNNNQPTLYPYKIKINKCSESCNITNDPHANLCVLDVVKT